MVATVGKKLQQARREKRISIEDASRATKVRPDRLADLEQDDFTNFPNLTYAKGFLMIYAKYLDVDVAEFASSFENTSQINLNSYDYLTNASEPAPEVVHHHVPSVASSSSHPFRSMVVLGAVVFLVLVGFGIKILNDTAKRLTPSTKTEPTPAAASSTPAVPSQLVESDQNVLKSALPPQTPRPIGEAPVTAMVKPDSTTRFVGEPEVRRPLPVNPADTLNNDPPTPAPAPLKTKELVIQPIRKTWVLVQRDDDHSTPVFDDWIYPDARPLKVRGSKFWIEVRDPDAVKNSKDGQPVQVAGNRFVVE